MSWKREKGEKETKNSRRKWKESVQAASELVTFKRILNLIKNVFCPKNENNFWDLGWIWLTLPHYGLEWGVGWKWWVIYWVSDGAKT